MKSIIIVVLIACIFPYIFVVLARIYCGFKFTQHCQQPRQFLAQLARRTKRANAIQQNSFESLLVFLPAVLLSLQVMTPLILVHQICIFYLMCRVAYVMCYLADWAILRLVMCFLSLLSSLFLFILAIYFS